MVRHSFLNVPDDIVAKIEEQPQSNFEVTFRLLYHKGLPEASDFLPTFVDEKQREIREKRKNCGTMANIVVSHHKKPNVKDYGVSLSLSLDDAKKKFWKNAASKKDYPAIAQGPTNPSKGYSVKDNETHVSYYLYDYVDNNPFEEFCTIEEADLDD